MLSNVRSLCNKFDEVECRVGSLSPNIIVFTEFWLDSDIPDSSISLSDYSIVCEDRTRFGGDVIVYISNNELKFQTIDIESVNTLVSSCESGILPILFPTIKLLMIAIYHPLWNDNSKHDRAISSICDIIDYVFSLPAFDPLSTKIG